MRFHVITLFPTAFDSYLGESIIKRAINGIKPRRAKRSGSRPKASGKISVKFYNPRDFSDNKFRHIDQKPYAGGPGMVIEALPVIRAIEKAVKASDSRSKIQESGMEKSKKSNKSYSRILHPAFCIKIIWLTPNGKQFDTTYAKKTAKKYTDIIIICGRYEGIDARVKKIFKMEEISVGPFVLTGGELPAMILIDCISRQVPGVLGNFDSLEESRTASSDVYTRPEILTYKNKKYRVPKVLLSGDHKKIEEWRRKN